MTNLIVMAKVTVHPQYTSQASALLIELACKSEQESGCLSYKILPSLDEGNVFTTLEVWESSEAEMKHWNTDHLKTIIAKLNPLLAAEARIEKYTEVKTI
ncbi:putative quinol monooxygenase [Microbulbifer sp. JMSA003]|uniref:putative quinol monooxygenase n=1 Tax=Microbulbifer sp. JMSA003 TaxID=3243369 RepID=UPI004039D952